MAGSDLKPPHAALHPNQQSGYKLQLSGTAIAVGTMFGAQGSVNPGIGLAALRCPICSHPFLIAPACAAPPLFYLHAVHHDQPPTAACAESDSGFDGSPILAGHEDGAVSGARGTLRSLRIHRSSMMKTKLQVRGNTGVPVSLTVAHVHVTSCARPAGSCTKREDTSDDVLDWRLDTQCIWRENLTVFRAGVSGCVWLLSRTSKTTQ